MTPEPKNDPKAKPVDGSYLYAKIIKALRLAHEQLVSQRDLEACARELTYAIEQLALNRAVADDRQTSPQRDLRSETQPMPQDELYLALRQLIELTTEAPLLEWKIGHCALRVTNAIRRERVRKVATEDAPPVCENKELKNLHAIYERARTLVDLVQTHPGSFTNHTVNEVIQLSDYHPFRMLASVVGAETNRRQQPESADSSCECP